MSKALLAVMLLALLLQPKVAVVAELVFVLAFSTAAIAGGLELLRQTARQPGLNHPGRRGSFWGQRFQ